MTNHRRSMLILVLGLRKGEALGLAWEDVDLDGPLTEPIPGKRLIRRAVERARGWGHGRG